MLHRGTPTYEPRMSKQSFVAIFCSSIGLRARRTGGSFWLLFPPNDSSSPAPGHSQQAIMQQRAIDEVDEWTDQSDPETCGRCSARELIGYCRAVRPYARAGTDRYQRGQRPGGRDDGRRRRSSVAVTGWRGGEVGGGSDGSCELPVMVSETDRRRRPSRGRESE